VSWLSSRKGKSKSKPGYVEPPELRAGLVVLFDGQVWRVSARNAGDGRVPTDVPGTPEVTAGDLADEFAAGWRRANEGAAAVPDIKPWVGDAAAWDRFFRAGGAAFQVRVKAAGGITATRYGWSWTATGSDPVWPSDRPADNLTVHSGPQWRDEPDGVDWATAAAWMRDRAGADPRVAAWWVADEQADPRTPVVTDIDAVDGLRVWWTGNWYPTGTPILQRYGLVAPEGDGFWFAWLRWDPAKGADPADILGLRRAGDGVDVVWWPAGGTPIRSGPHSVDRVERLLGETLVFERPPPDVEWTEVARR
jgi:hypothetical protein